jgi:hypothetical protein
MAMRLKWSGADVKRKVDVQRRQALSDSAEFGLSRANDSVPLEEGTLARSGSTDVDDDTAVISYDTAYAIRLHENPQYNFKHGRRGKWLELALQEIEPQLLRFWGGRIHIG